MAYFNQYYNKGRQFPTTQASEPAQMEPTSFDWGKAAGYANTAIQGFTGGQQSTDNFSIDPNAGYKGSAAGFAQGGPVMAAIQGVTAQIGTFSQANKNLKNLDTSVQGSTTDAQGNVMYSGDQMANAYSKIGQLNQGDKAITGSLDPATRVFSGLFGTRKKIKKARRRLAANQEIARQDFNEAYATQNEQRLARESYNQSLNNYNRLYNLYNR